MNHDEGVASAVTRMAEQFVAIWNTHDMTGLADIYADDADFVNVIGTRWKVTATSVEAKGSAIRRVPAALKNPAWATRPSRSRRAAAAEVVERSRRVPFVEWILVSNGRIKLKSL